MIILSHLSACGNTLGALPIENGGTGLTSEAAIKEWLESLLDLSGGGGGASQGYYLIEAPISFSIGGMSINTGTNFNVTVDHSGASGSSGFTNGNLLSLVSAKYTFNFTELENSYTGFSKIFGGIRVYTGASAGSRTNLKAQANYPGKLDYNNTGTLSVTANVKAGEYITLCAFPGESFSMGYNAGHTGLLTIM